ncbi:MAG: DUF465 domain-containing protein [Pseudomonadota bacterium]
MSTEARLAALERRHAAVEAELQVVVSNPSGDSLAAANLKREKLRLKDEMERLRE